MKRSREG